MSRQTKLELTWINKDNVNRLEPRILLANQDKSYHAQRRVTEEDIYDNLLIHGDNLLALKALEQDFRSKVQCIYIDPPFNTHQAFEHYEDGLEHSLWLSLMRERLLLLHTLLSDTGSLFIHIDDNELGYLIALTDEIFQRNNRMAVITFKQGSPTGHKAINPGFVSTSNFLLVYAKNKSKWSPNRLYTARERDERYNQFIVNRFDDFKEWKITTLVRAFAKDMDLLERDARNEIRKKPELLDEFVIKNADSVIQMARPDYNAVSSAARNLIDESQHLPDEIFKLKREGYSDMYLKSGKRFLFYSDKLKLIDGEYVAGEPLTTIWDDLLSNNLHQEGGVDFPKGKKPEALIKRILELSTQSGDLILDSFAGSGTTGAVAHKMGRRWIMVELGEHCDTHIIPRLHRLIDGNDPSGVTKATNWKGGGGFRYLRLAPSLLEKDQYDNWIINKRYNGAMLAEAICKLENFTYQPNAEHYWQHGYSTERDFIYVTTQTLSYEQLTTLSEEVGSGQSLLVCCTAFRSKSLEDFSNLTLKKLPRAVMSRCEWGKDDYSLEISSLALTNTNIVTSNILSTQTVYGQNDHIRSTDESFHDVEDGLILAIGEDTK